MPNASQPVIFNPDFFVERLKHEHPQVFTDLVLSNITRLIDLPGEEFAQFIGDSDPKIQTASGFLRSFNFLKRKGQTHRIIILPRVVSDNCPMCGVVTIILCYLFFVKSLQSKLWRKNNVLSTAVICKYNFAVIKVKQKNVCRLTSIFYFIYFSLMQ